MPNRKRSLGPETFGEIHRKLVRRWLLPATFFVASISLFYWVSH